LHTRFASDAAAVVEIDDAVVTAKECARRAYVNAGRIVAMVAAHHAEMAAGVRKLTLFDVLDPGTENAKRDVVLFLASDCARVTADTAVVINYEAVPQFASPRVSQPILLGKMPVTTSSFSSTLYHPGVITNWPQRR
jgi:hypothetical protein